MIVNTKIGVDLLQLRQLLQIHTQQFFSLVILEQEQILWAVSKKKDLVEIALISALCYC